MSISLQVSQKDLNTRKDIYLNLLPKNVSVDKFIGTAVSAVATNSDLSRCSQNSILIAINKAAQDGLMIDGKQAVIVPFGNSATYMPMLAGLRLIVDDTKRFTIGKVAIVYEGEPFEHYVDNGDVILKHMPNSENTDQDKAIGAYAYVKDKETNELICEYMNKETILKIKNDYSKKPEAAMWTIRWTEGYKKTVYRQLAKQLPLANNDRFQSAINHDNENYDLNNVTPQPKSAKEAVKELLTKPTTKESSVVQKEEPELEIPIKFSDGKTLIFPLEINAQQLIDLTQTYHTREQEEGMLTDFLTANKGIMPKLWDDMYKENPNWTEQLKSNLTIIMENNHA